jgi:hypothetical protein
MHTIATTITVITIIATIVIVTIVATTTIVTTIRTITVLIDIASVCAGGSETSAVDHLEQRARSPSSSRRGAFW